MTSSYAGPMDRLQAYERVVATVPDLERKGAAMPYTSRNGHMFSFLDASGEMSLRLPPDARADFMSRYSAVPSVQHGRPMKDYVLVPDDLLDRTDELREWFVKADAWIGTLKPKPTKRRRQ